MKSYRKIVIKADQVSATVQKAALLLLGVFAWSLLHSCAPQLYTKEDLRADAATLPQDEAPHEHNSLEWWYTTGFLYDQDDSSQVYGVEFVFFHFTDKTKKERQMVHAAISHLGEERLIYSSDISRWEEPETLPLDFEAKSRKEHYTWTGQEGNYQLFADGIEEGTGFRLETLAQRPAVLHSGTGYQRYGDSFSAGYFSYPFMQTKGQLWLNGDTINVGGDLWMDRQWDCGGAISKKISWSWMALHFEEPKLELMLFIVEDRKKGLDIVGGTVSQALDEDQAIYLEQKDLTIEPLACWESPHSGRNYPVKWKVNVLPLNMELEVQALYDDQELVFRPFPLVKFSYWEGMIEAKGLWDGRPMSAQGYLEITNAPKRLLEE